MKEAAKMTADSGYAVPLLVSRFPFRRHPGFQEIRSDCEEYYERIVKRLITAKNDVAHGYFVNCGGDYVSYIYPSSGISEAKAIARFYCLWVVLDDRIDNSTNHEEVASLLAKMGDVINAPDTDTHDGYNSISAALTLARSHGGETLTLAQDSLLAFLEATLRIREIEINKERVSHGEYLNLRAINTAMPCMHAFIPLARPELAADMTELSGRKEFERALIYSGKAIGLTMDLYCLVPKHAEISDYTNAVRIMERDLPAEAGRQEAIDRCASLFQTYEEKMETELKQVALTHPAAAQAMMEVQAGSVLWLGDMRGRRYLDL